MKPKKGATIRIGAAGVAAGILLLGAQSLGLAAADSGDVDTGRTASSVAAGSAGSDAPQGAAQQLGSPAAGNGRAIVRSVSRNPAPAAATARGDRQAVAWASAAVEADQGEGQKVGPQSSPSRQRATASIRSSVAVQAPRVGTVAAAVSSMEAGAEAARVLGAAAETVVTSGASPSAAATFDVASLDVAVAAFFDNADEWLSGLPGGPVTDFLEGALLLVRRSLFNRTPTAAPYSYLTTGSGQIVGTLGGADAEGDALSYSLARTPDYGTVQIGPDGTYTYTPGPNYAGGDVFTVEVRDGGFNILDPFGSRTTQVTVAVPYAGPVRGYTNGWDVRNSTGDAVTLTSLFTEPGYEDAIDGAPPIGTVLQPGDSAHFELTWYAFYSYGAGPVFAGPAGNQWKVVLYTATSNPLWDSTRCDVGDCRVYRNSYLTDYHGVQLLDPPGSVEITAETPDAAARLGKLLSLVSADPSCTWAGCQNQNWTDQYLNVSYNSVQADDPGWTRVLNLDNPSDNSKSSGSQSITASFSATKATSQKCAVPNCDYGLNFATAKMLITKLITKTVSNNYGVSESQTETKTFMTTINQGLLPWSANEVLTAPPTVNVDGDVAITYEDWCADDSCGGNQGTGGKRTYVFHNVAFEYPSQLDDKPLYVIRTEPLQPKVNGRPLANVGFTVKDKASEFLDPTYTVGKQVQLTTTAFGGYGGDTADYTRRATYTSSDASVAEVSASGVLTAKAPGTTTITARYDWTIPLGNGATRSDYVLATMEVTVKKGWF